MGETRCRTGDAPEGLQRVFDIMLGSERERRVALYAPGVPEDDRELSAARAHCRERGLRIEHELLESDAGARRSARELLAAVLDSGEVCAVVVSQLRRLAPSLEELAACVRDLQQRGVALIVVEDEIDTSTRSGRALLRLLGCLESFERERLRESTRAGLAAARRRGRRLGRPPTPIPVAEAENMIADGVPVAEVARRLRVSRSSLRRALERARVSAVSGRARSSPDSPTPLR